ncbi:MAG: hypothetical protein ACOYXC_14320 [Candidatus Rifleibacteriota bacterium]
MRILKERWLKLVILFILAIPAGASALELFLMLSYQDKGRVYRVKTSNEGLLPTGYLFESEPADGFFVDNYFDFRLLITRDSNLYEPENRTLFRQVFDGTVADAENGLQSMTHQDMRDQLIADSLARPVFRPVGAPLSCGTGRKISVRPDKSNFLPGECEILPDHDWYQIPNGSWYQTWHKISEGERSSYLIHFDEWQKGSVEVIETLWRGVHPAYVTQRPLHQLESSRLLRALTDGSLELVNGYEKSFVAAEKRASYAWAFNPGFNVSKGELLLYSWLADKPGKLRVIGRPGEFQTGFESKEPGQRFVGIAGMKAVVIGTDIMRGWLAEASMQEAARVAECSLAAFHYSWETNLLQIMVYSNSDQKLYRFFYDTQQNRLMGSPEQFVIDMKPDAILFDLSGSFYITAMQQAECLIQKDVEPGYEVETMQLYGLDGVAEFDEEKGKYVNSTIPEQVRGHIVFSRSYSQNVFWFGNNRPELIYSADLGKEFLFREFELNRPPLDLLNYDYYQVMTLAGKPGNRLSELKPDVPGYPDQYVKPQKAFLGFYQR